MDAFLQIIGSAGLPTSFVGLIMFLYFSVRKQEASIRAEQIATIERLRAEIVELDSAKDKAVAIAEKLRNEVNSKDVEIARLLVRLARLGDDGQTLNINGVGSGMDNLGAESMRDKDE